MVEEDPMTKKWDRDRERTMEHFDWMNMEEHTRETQYDAGFWKND